MPRVVIFHHALGITPGIEAFADKIRAAGYAVQVPDLFGRTFDTIEQGVAHAEQVGFETIIERGVESVGEGDEPLVVIGFSLGVLPAQKLAQTRPGVRGAVLCHSAVPLGMFSDTWPPGAALQLHLVEADPSAEEDLAAARDLATASGGELHLYPGTGHLIADQSHSDYDAEAAQAILERTLQLLRDVG